MNTAPHIPVLLDEVIASLAPKDGEVYADGTYGAGGYSKAILARAQCRVIGIDRDETAYTRACDTARDFDGRLQPVHGTFGDIATHLDALGIDGIDGFVLDLGVSSMQIDDAARGFSFNKDGPLDMRMDRQNGEPASTLVNSWPEEKMSEIFWKYGEERHARRIARAIVNARASTPITTTKALADIIAASMPASARKFAIHPATRSFQALRIVVNGELEQLESALAASLDILNPGGRLVVVSFHSLEDTIVKNFFRENGPTQGGSRHLPEPEKKPALFRQPEKKSIGPSDQEIAKNPRARSAKLRWGIRTDERKAA